MLADIILVTHFSFIIFIVGGFVLIWIGKLCSWQWIKNFWFRAIHVSAMALVILQTLVGLACPLTVWENQLRSANAYSGGFIEHWLHKIMFYDFSRTVFIVAYIVFLLLILLTYLFVPMQKKSKG